MGLGFEIIIIGPAILALIVLFIANIGLGIAAIVVPDSCVLNDPSKISFMPIWNIVNALFSPLYMCGAIAAYYIMKWSSSGSDRILEIYIGILIAWTAIGVIYFSVASPECISQLIGPLAITSFVINMISVCAAVAIRLTGM